MQASATLAKDSVEVGGLAAGIEFTLDEILNKLPGLVDNEEDNAVMVDKTKKWAETVLAQLQKKGVKLPKHINDMLIDIRANGAPTAAKRFGTTALFCFMFLL